MTLCLLATALVGCSSHDDIVEKTLQTPRPAITLSLAKAGNPLTLTLTTDQADAFIDLNMNGRRDQGEEITSAKAMTITPKLAQLDIYGSIQSLNLMGQEVTQVAGQGLEQVKSLNLSGTAVSEKHLEDLIALLGSTQRGTLTLEQWRLSTLTRQRIKEFGWKVQTPQGKDIDLDESLLLIRVPKGFDTKGVACELSNAKDLWVDKNLNGEKDDDEALPTGSLALNMPANLPSGESLYILHGSALGLELYPASTGDEDSDIGAEDKDDEDEDEDVRALRAEKPAPVEGISVDASRMTTLQSLECAAATGVTEVNVSGCKALATMTLSGNPIRSLILPTSSALQTLQAAGNQLTELSLASQSKLSTLSLPNGQLKSLIVLGLESLVNLNLSANQLDEITLPKMDKLKNVNLKGNKISALRLEAEKYPALEVFNIEGNQLQEADLTAFDKTKLINVANNPLKSLILPWTLKELNVSATQLTSLNLDPKDPKFTNFIQTLDASACPLLKEITITKCENLSKVNLKGSTALTGDKILAGFPVLPNKNGHLQITAGQLSAEQMTALKAKGWSL